MKPPSPALPKRLQLFAPARTRMTTGKSGAIYLSNPDPLPQPSRCLGDWLVRWAGEKPDAIFLADNATPDNSWQMITYRQMLQRVEKLAGWLLDTPAGPRRPIAILSQNSIEHAVAAFACLHVGIPVAAISTAYSLMSRDHAALKAMIALLDPGVIYVSDPALYASAIAAVKDLSGAQWLYSTGAPPAGLNATVLKDAANPDNTPAALKAFAAITPETVARLLFTSGSTGVPKAVINTHLMLTSNQEAKRVVWPFLKAKPPVIVDWLPWSHTFGCNFCMNMVLRNGGTMYIDDGRPAPHLVHKTVRNIKRFKPNMCFNVPRGFDMLAGELESDAEFRKVFFAMDLLMYAAAALSQSTWERLRAMSTETTGRAIAIVSAWGATETAPLATSCHFQAGTSGNIGVPVPGTGLKLVPNGDKLEVRAKGPNVTPGYYKMPEQTRRAFDEEGYYLTGDAVRLVDAEDASKGLYFDGRVSEDFKLATGTWVSAGQLRLAGIDALAPVAQDIVVTGHDRDFPGFLVFPNEAACRKLAGLDDDAPIDEVLASTAVTGRVRQGLADLRRQNPGSSRHALCARFLAEPPDPDAGEITDKAYLNQRRVLANRASQAELLYSAEPVSGIHSPNIRLDG